MAKNRETVFVFHDHGKLTTLLLYIYLILSPNMLFASSRFNPFILHVSTIQPHAETESVVRVFHVRTILLFLLLKKKTLRASFATLTSSPTGHVCTSIHLYVYTVARVLCMKMKKL